MIALREIEEGLINGEIMDQFDNQQAVKQDIAEKRSNFILSRRSSKRLIKIDKFLKWIMDNKRLKG